MKSPLIALSISEEKSSILRIKRYEDSGSFSLKPLDLLKKPEGLPFIIMEKEALVMHHLIQAIHHFSLKPILCRTLSKKF